MSDSATGQAGGRIISDAATHTPDDYIVWFAIYIITDTVFDAGTASNLNGTITGITYSAGFTLYGRFTAIQLVSGDVVAYEKAEAVI